MKVSKLSILLASSLLTGTIQSSYSQCLTGACNVQASASDTQICPGETVTLTGIGNNNLLNNNFNNQTVGTGWTLNNINVMFNNPCGANGSDGTPYLWFGNTSGAGQRLLTSVDFDVTAGGQIEFDLRFSIQSGASPCEGPDEPDEGVYLQYSTNFGASWTTIFYYDPDINNTSGSTASPYTQWANYTHPIPAAAQTTCTRFRWIQEQVSGTGNDHWGLDNINIGAYSNPGTTVFQWLDNGAPGDVPRTVQPSVTTSYVLMYATAVDTCLDTVTVEVQNFAPLQVDAGPDRTICANSQQSFVGNITGGVAPYTGTWFYPGGAGTNPLTFTPTAANAGDYILIVSHACEPGVQVSDTLTVTLGLPQFQLALDVDSISCYNTNDGAINLTVTGQTPPFTYIWTPGNITTQDLSNLGPNTYSLTVRDTFGCRVDTTITLIQPDNIPLSFTDRFICSYDSVALQPIALPNTAYSWSPSAYIFDANDPSPMFYGENLGPQYDTIQVAVESTSLTGCGRDTFNVYLSPLPEVQLGLPGLDTMAICNNDTVFLSNALTNSGFPLVTNHLWQDNSTTTVYPTLTPGLYWLQLTNTANCTARDSIQLIKPDKMILLLDSIFYSCNMEYVEISASGYAPSDNLLWNTGATTDTISVNQPGTYTIIASNNCTADTASTQLIQLPDVQTSDLPNIFTPNGDQLNETYHANGMFESAVNFNVKVFTRWGNKIFETEDKEINWSPKNISDGVYYMTIEYTDCKNEVKKLGQSVTVISN